MVKGISRQVILVQSPDPKMFEQAIFILKENVKEVTDAELLKEANSVIRGSGKRKRQFYGPFWACGGAALTGLIWLITVLL